MPFAGQIIRALDFVPSVYGEQSGNEDNFTNTEFAPGANICGIAFMAPTSGAGTIYWQTRFGSIGDPSTNANVSVHVRTGAVINAGTTHRSPDQNTSLENPAAGTDSVDNRLGAASFIHLNDLAAGDVYNAVLVHSVDAGSATIFHRTILWVPSP